MYMHPTTVGIKSGSPDAFLEEPLSGMLKAKILESQIIQDVPGGATKPNSQIREASISQATIERIWM